jgi:hypothetical protein
MSIRHTVIQRKQHETAPFPFRGNYIYKSGMTDYGPKIGEKRLKTTLVFGRFRTEFSRFRPYKAPFPTLGMNDLGG